MSGGGWERFIYATRSPCCHEGMRGGAPSLAGTWTVALAIVASCGPSPSVGPRMTVEALDLPTAADLRGVAVDPGGRIWVVGDDRAAWVREDGRWTDVGAGIEQGLGSIDIDASGAVYAGSFV